MRVKHNFLYFFGFFTFFSLFFFPTLLYAQSTPWSFYNNSSQSNSMDIFYNSVTAVNPALRIGTNGNVRVTGTLTQSGTGDNYFTGNLGIGIGTPNSKLYVYDSKTINAAYTSNTLSFSSVNSGTKNANTHVGLNVSSISEGGAGIAGLVGIQSGYGANWGGIDNAYGVLVQPVFGANGYQSMTNSYALYANSPYFGNLLGATIGQQYGLYIAAQKVSNTATTPSTVGTGYGIYQAGASDTNYFGGNTQFVKQVGINGYGPGGCGSYGLCVMGSAYTNGTWSPSDFRLKKDIQPIANGLERILKLDPVTFEYNKEKYPNQQFPDGRQMGFIAQQVESVVPEVMSTFKINDEEYKALDYAHLTALLTQAIHEQQSEITDLKTSLTHQQLELEEMKQQIRLLQSK